MGKKAHTTRDCVEIDLDGPIDAAIKTLQEMKKEYPDGEVELQTYVEWGETYARLRINFTRNKSPIELEMDYWRRKLEEFRGLATAAAAYEAEGDEYPRAIELSELENELGAWAVGRMGGDLAFFDNEIVMWSSCGYQRRDGSWAMRTFWKPDETGHEIWLRERPLAKGDE